MAGNPFIPDLADFQAPHLSGVREAARSMLFRAGGKNLGMGNVAATMQLFGGPKSGFTAREMEMSIRRISATSQSTSTKLQDLLQIGQVAQQVGWQFGVDPRVGMGAAQSSTVFAQQFQKMAGGGKGGLSPTEARAIDLEMRMAAAKSPMANMLGAAVAMAEAGVLKGEIAKNLTNPDPKVKRAALEQLSRTMTPASFVDHAAAAGIDPGVAAQFLGASRANQEIVARHKIQDVVREIGQPQEMAETMRQQLGQSFETALRKGGATDADAEGLSRAAGEAIRAELERMASKPGDRAKLTDPTQAAQRNRMLTSAVTEALGGQAGMFGGEEGLNMLVKQSIQGMEERIRVDPNLQKFKDVMGLIDINRGDIMGATRTAQAELDKKAHEGLGRKDPQAEKLAADQAKREDVQRQRQDRMQKLQENENERTNRIKELKKRLGIDEGIGGATKMAALQALGAVPGGDWLLTGDQRELTRLNREQAQLDKQREEAQKGPGGGAAPGQQPIKITGILTVKADGSALVEAEGGLPVN